MQSSTASQERGPAKREVSPLSPRKGYPPYYQVATLEEQVAVLVDMFPELKVDAFNEYIRTRLPPELPSGAEGWFAVPRRSALGHDSYLTSMHRVNSAMKSRNAGYMWGIEHYQYLKPVRRTSQMLATLEQRQRGDILVVAAQFGMRHVGKSVHDVSTRLVESEFGLGAFEIACMLLTNPTRLRSPNDLFVDCPGDIYNVGGGPDSSRALYFDFEKSSADTNRSLNLRHRFVDEVDPQGRFGSVTGFLF